MKLQWMLLAPVRRKLKINLILVIFIQVLSEVMMSFMLFHSGRMPFLQCWPFQSQSVGQCLKSLFNWLTLPAPIPGKEKKITFYFHTSFWCLKRFHEALKVLHKTFWGTTKKCEKENLSKFFILILIS